MLWIRLAIVGVIVAALSAATFKVTSWLQEREHQIRDLNVRVEGLEKDNERLRRSNDSLAADRDKKRDELALAQKENNDLHTTDAASAKRLNEFERKVSDRERLEQMVRLTNSRHANLVLDVVNRSAKCELENFFQTGGTCKGGVWVKDGERLIPITQPSSAQPRVGQSPVPTEPVGESHEPQ